jgi:hypothetical protein
VSHTINIISNSDPFKPGGPAKVLANALLGLQRIGQSYVINQNLVEYEWNWIHDSVPALIAAVVNKKPAVVGPNLFVTPQNFPFFLPRLTNFLYLHPSAWPIDLWNKFKFDQCELRSWPVGIDWEEFNFPAPVERNEVLLYFKNRKPELKERVICELKNQGFKINLIEYGSYDEKNYKSVLSRSFFGVWIGTTESQGIALQEALAANVPLIVLNNRNILDHYRKERFDLPKILAEFKATSVPYFDQTCGIVIDDLSELPAAIAELNNNYNRFAPREFIKKNLSLEKSAQQLVSFFTELEAINVNRPLRKVHFAAALIGFITTIHTIRRYFIKARRMFNHYLHLVKK